MLVCSMTPEEKVQELKHDYMELMPSINAWAVTRLLRLQQHHPPERAAAPSADLSLEPCRPHCPRIYAPFHETLLRAVLATAGHQPKRDRGPGLFRIKNHQPRPVHGRRRQNDLFHLRRRLHDLGRPEMHGTDEDIHRPR